MGNFRSHVESYVNHTDKNKYRLSRQKIHFSKFSLVACRQLPIVSTLPLLSLHHTCTMNHNANIRLPTGTRIEEEHHASRGIGKAYPKEMREQVISRHLLGLPVTTPDIQQLRTLKKYPCEVTCNRWINQHHLLGHVRPKKRNGNHRAEREIQGQALINLALLRCVRQKSTIAEVRAYLFNMDPTVDPYSPSQVYRAETFLDLTRKAASTTADLAYSALNLQKRDMYWTWNYPHGMADVDTDDIIDIDECGLFLETSNRNHGKVARGRRCDQRGVYNRGQKMNLLLAVCADRNYPMRWEESWIGEGTTLYRFYNYMHRIVDDLAQQHPGRSFCFTMDNLNVHKNPMVVNLILNAGHRLVFRAPYWAVDGAIEYVFNTLQTTLMVYYNKLNSMEDLENKVRQIIGAMETFRPYFQHVGFR